MSFAHELEMDFDTSFSRKEVITPARARDLLLRNERNRNASSGLVKEIASAMLDGRWRINGETIKISKEGNLLDGQHRLLACVQAQTSFETHVAYNVNTESVSTIDIGRKRTGGDVLMMHGCRYGNVVSSAFKIISVVGDGGVVTDGAVRLSPDMILSMWRNDPSIEESALIGHRAKDLIAPGRATAMHYLFKQKDQAAADKFFHDLTTGEELKANDPVHVLRNRLLRLRSGRVPTRDYEVIVLVIRAWNHRRTGTETVLLKGFVKDSNGNFHIPTII